VQDVLDWLGDLTVTPFQDRLIVAIVAGGLVWLGARINSSTQARREREAKEAERRHSFERDSLVAVHDALDGLYRLVEETVVKRFPDDRPDIRQVKVDPEPLEYRRAKATVSNLQVRVLDDDLRALVRRAVEEADHIMRSGSRTTVHTQNEVLKELSQELHEKLGERIRHLYKS
jgi:hypothetical protein